MGFLSPLALGGLALASIPIIIHLLNRRRFVIVDWAPMKYLKLTIRTNRRRLKLEQWLLLAIRTLAIICLFLAVARPTVSGATAARFLGGTTRTSHVLVIDDSLSMGYELDQRSAFAQARDMAVATVRDTPSQDTLSVFVASQPTPPLARDLPAGDTSALRDQLGRLELSSTASQWPAALKQADDLLASAPFKTREVVVITDLRRSGWDASIKTVCDKWASEGVTLRVVDVGSRRTDNVALLALKAEDPVGVLPGVEAKFTAEVRNDTPTPLASVQAVLTVDEAPRTVLLPELAPGQVTRVPLTATFAKPGQHVIKFALPPDALPQDNARWLSVPVRERFDVVMVDGESGGRAFENTNDFLQLALSVGADPWTFRRMSEAEFLGAAPSSLPAADLLVLSNVSNVPAGHAAAIEKLVRDGMGLFVFAGDQLDLQSYNEHLYRNGTGVLPARLDRVVDEITTGLAVEQLERSPLEPLTRVAPAALARVKTRKFVRAVVAPDSATTTRVLARWNERDGAPAVVEKRAGKGLSVLWTVTADRKWTDWPIEPIYVLAVRSAGRLTARAFGQDQTLVVGQSLRYRTEEETRPIDPRVNAPGADAAQACGIETAENAPAVVTYADTLRAGVYTVGWKNSLGAATSALFAVNADKSESDLASISDAELAAMCGNLKPVIVHQNAGDNTDRDARREVWRTLAMIVLTLVVVEALLAMWVGRER